MENDEVMFNLLYTLKEASRHLDFVGYGDEYERECSGDLESRIEIAIEQAEEYMAKIVIPRKPVMIEDHKNKLEQMAKLPVWKRKPFKRSKKYNKLHNKNGKGKETKETEDN